MPTIRTVLRRLTVATTATASLLAVAAPAHAAAVDLENDGATLTNQGEWQFFQYASSTLGGTGDFAIVDDAALVGGQTDAFDGGLAVSLDGVAIGAKNAVAQVNGRRLTSTPVTVAGLRVQIGWYALANSSTLRILVKMTNPGAQDKRRDLRIGTNLGSDGTTTIGATSSGDTTFTTADRWLVTDDTFVPGDPAVLQVYGGKGKVATRTNVARPFTDTFVVTTSVRVPAKKTRYFMAFADLATDASASAVAANRFETRVPTGGVLSGLSAGVRAAIVNWDL